MLQNEVNPHFIYNTLNSIRWMATIQHAPGIAEMVTAFARLTKSISKGTQKLVPLQEELALLNDYFTIYNALYGRDGHGVDPGEPEKKSFACFCQMVGRDLGQLLGTNLMVCVLCLPAALGVSLGVTLFSLPITVVFSAVTGLLVGSAMVLLADCALRSLQNNPSQ